MREKKQILVTGAGGYIGRHVVKWLLDNELDVLAVDFNLEGIDNRAQKMEIDIFNGNKNIYETLGKPDICLHMAWKDGFIHNSEEHMNYLSSHYKFISDLSRSGLKHISVLGTMHEIGYWEGEVDENTPTKPYSLYGVAKNSLREALEVLFQNTDTIFQWLRVFYILGDDTRNNSIFSKIIAMEENGQVSFPFTSGKNKYDFIEIDELAENISISVTQKEISGIINCCTGNPVALKEKVEEFLKTNNYKITPEYGVYPERKYDSPAIWGSNKKIMEIKKKYYSKKGEKNDY